MQLLSQSNSTFTRALSSLTQSLLTQLCKTAGLYVCMLFLLNDFSRDHIQ